MRPQHIMYLGLLFAAGTLISLTFFGGWIDDSDLLQMTNSLTVFKDASIMGVWTVSIPNIDFFFVGIKSMMMMDFAFFQGPTEIIGLVFELVLVSGIMWGIFTIVIYIIQGVLTRTR